MGPAMALITDSSLPAHRGRFMSLNSAVQLSAAGIATWIAGVQITINQDGTLQGYEQTGLVAALFSILGMLWVKKLFLGIVDFIDNLNLLVCRSRLHQPTGSAIKI